MISGAAMLDPETTTVLSSAFAEMDLSLVVCTRNRAPQLPEALAALARIQSDRAWELVIVDNGSTDDTPRLLQAAVGHFAGRLRLVHEPRAGLGRARNTGWRAATGDIVAFTDDDCYPAATLVDDILACFTDPAIGFMGGRILLFDPTDLPLTIQLHDRRVAVDPGQVVSSGLIQGANFAFRRRVLQAIDGFDAALGAGTPFACEDVDALCRASLAGWKGVYDPRPYVYHHHRRKTADDARKLKRSYDFARGAYYAKAIMNRSAARLYAGRWLHTATRQNPLRTLRELNGGLAFLLQALRRGHAT
jgi:glycosyltransferase involved in cell wall biosynthesis